MDSTGVITQDAYFWDSDPFIMLPCEDLPLHLMFSLHNVHPETPQGDLTRRGFVTANRIPHSRGERGALRVAWEGSSISPPARSPAHYRFCFAPLQSRRSPFFLFSQRLLVRRFSKLKRPSLIKQRCTCQVSLIKPEQYMCFKKGRTSRCVQGHVLALHGPVKKEKRSSPLSIDPYLKFFSVQFLSSRRNLRVQHPRAGGSVRGGGAERDVRRGPAEGPRPGGLRAAEGVHLHHPGARLRLRPQRHRGEKVAQVSENQ